jgi:hypothetical protein
VRDGEARPPLVAWFAQNLWASPLDLADLPAVPIPVLSAAGPVMRQLPRPVITQPKERSQKRSRYPREVIAVN